MTVEGIKALNTDGTWSGNVYTVSNTTYEILVDNANNVIGIKVNSSGASAVNKFILGIMSVKSGDVLTINGSSSSYTDIQTKIFCDSTSAFAVGNRLESGGGNAVTRTAAADDNNVAPTIYVYSGVSLDNLIYYPMIRLATESDATFAPYSNICPISGRVSTSVSTTDGEDTESVTIAFGTTVYGGTLNVTTGVLTIDKATMMLDGSDMSGWVYWTESTGLIFISRITVNALPNKIPLSNLLKGASTPASHEDMAVGVDDGNLWIRNAKLTSISAWSTWLASNNLQICYELATPTTLQLMPDELTMLKGDNSVSGDGVITITALTGDAWGGDE